MSRLKPISNAPRAGLVVDGPTTPTDSRVKPSTIESDLNLPVVDSVLSNQSDSKSGESLLKKIAIGSATILGGATLAVLVVAIASGLAQDYARRKRYKAGGGSFWAWLAKIPSLRYPKPVFNRVEHRFNGRNNGTISTNSLYDEISLIPAVSTDSKIVLLDDWGGWFNFTINTGAGDELVLWVDDGNQTFGALGRSGDIVTYRIPQLSQVYDIIYSMERL